MEFLEGFLPSIMKGKVLRLLCAIYGLKQAGLAWWCALDKSMQELGFERLKSDTSLFVYKRGKDIVLAITYVDDTEPGQKDQSCFHEKMGMLRSWETT